MDLIIEGNPATLEWLRRQIHENCADEVALEAVPAQDAGELREPVTVALIVSLAGPLLVRSVVDVLRKRHAHAGDIAEINGELRLPPEDEPAGTELRLRVTDGHTQRDTSEDELLAGAA
ncbi:hypothetical protein BJY16_005312 [Actinoplanes octamycinicus]|uniref:Uncharacterized protein n=1 Tax=Actinoplanes octamycinicus TaxID=135948 RepID=A0A7W7H0U9_9ACTN|nr:hypothetical protein [Actinoplanes octamycinicus]MBB4741853.1 hypothetical protein [Actinoplanes octamycinicus]GIE60617.1 hypothetical protein Aoc01nite_60190 [Actinoplanes octamycinicus]